MSGAERAETASLAPSTGLSSGEPTGLSAASSTGLPTGAHPDLPTGSSTPLPTGSAPDGLAEADLLARLDARGIGLRPEEVAPVLATARFLARAAAMVREAS